MEMLPEIIRIRDYNSFGKEFDFFSFMSQQSKTIDFLLTKIGFSF